MTIWVDKVALITGGGSGIGQAFARLIVAGGGSAAIVDKDADAARETEAALGAERALAIAADVSSGAEVATAVERVIERFGRIDILHNNASILHRNDAIEDMAIDDFRRVIEINAVGSFICARAVVPAMKRQGAGCIINISSRGGLRGQAHTLAYSTSKAGIVSFTRGLAEQLRPFNIRAFALSVGLVETGMTSGGAYLTQAKREGRYVFRPDEMAAAVGYLAAKLDGTGSTFEYFGGSDGPEMRLLGDFSFEAVDWPPT